MRSDLRARQALLTRAIALAIAVVVMLPARASAWDSHTHKLIVRLAIDALPPSALKTLFVAHEAELQADAIAPDNSLRMRYGKAEAIRHYIDLEYYGADPFAALQPDPGAMERRYGPRMLLRSGTLPWTIESVAAASQDAWRRRDCAQAVLQSGYLAHYVGDASQPLHTTINFDGSGPDRGLHHRLEQAVDHEVARVATAARPLVHEQPIDSVWAAAIGEIRRSHGLVPETFAADRAARAESGARGGAAFDRALMAGELSMVARQVADAASVLASIWTYEWTQAKSPGSCSARSR